MTLSELRYVVAVATERSFGRAAQRCFVSQPALSVAIQKLEEELDVRLFERGKSEVTLTPVGGRIVEQAQKVLEEAALIKGIAQAGRNQLVGALKLGVIYTVAPYLLPDLIPALHVRAPQMPLDLEENLTAASRSRAEVRGASMRRSSRCPSRRRAWSPSSCTRSRSRSSSRWATSGRNASPYVRTSSPPSIRYCSTSAIASATRCSTPVRS